MKKELKKYLPVNVNTTITYEGTELSTQFSVKNKIKLEHQYNLFYFSKCPDGNCKESYVWKTDRIITEYITDQYKREKHSHKLKHSHESRHSHIQKNDFKITNSNYRNNIKRKISEVIYSWAIKPTLNVKEKLVKRNTYNRLLFQRFNSLSNILTHFLSNTTFYCYIIILDNLYLIIDIIDLTFLNGF